MGKIVDSQPQKEHNEPISENKDEKKPQVEHKKLAESDGKTIHNILFPQK